MPIETNGLTDEEQKAIDEQLKPVFAKNSISTIYSAGYMAFTKSIMKKSTQEAQIELNKWKTRGLNNNLMVTIAKDIANKTLVP